MVCSSQNLTFSLGAESPQPRDYSMPSQSSQITVHVMHTFLFFLFLAFMRIYSSPSGTGMYRQMTARIDPVRAIHTTLTAEGMRAA